MIKLAEIIPKLPNEKMVRIKITIVEIIFTLEKSILNKE